MLSFECWMLNCCGLPQCGIDQWWISMLSRDVLNTNKANVTNILLHTDRTLTDICSRRCAHSFWVTNKRIKSEFIWHTDLTDRTDTCSHGDAHMGSIERERHEWYIYGFDTEFCEHTFPSFSAWSRIFIFIFSNYRKACIHCSHLSKRLQIFTAVHLYV